MVRVFYNHVVHFAAMTKPVAAEMLAKIKAHQKISFPASDKSIEIILVLLTKLIYLTTFAP